MLTDVRSTFATREQSFVDNFAYPGLLACVRLLLLSYRSYHLVAPGAIPVMLRKLRSGARAISLWDGREQRQRQDIMSCPRYTSRTVLWCALDQYRLQE